MDNTFYITTPIYYVNDIPHLGTAYCTVAADVLARYERLLGKEVYFLTGTDEHGEKIQEAAEKKSMPPQAFTDEVSARFKDTWQKMGMSHDDFIRTTEPRHKKTVLHFIQKLLDQSKGKSKEESDIYLDHYEGWYCVSDETFFTESQLVNGKTPDGKDVKKVKEENYFFNLKKYIPKLKQHIINNPDFLLPESKRNEVLSFLEEDIRNLSISRTTFSWGIPFPKTSFTEKNHVVYVWMDALTNYLSALAPLENPKKFEKFWGTTNNPKAIHLIGKDILRFHAVYWPCFLMAMGLPLPKRIFAHGWWTIEGQKMSKSLGNTIEPIEFTSQYGQDSFRLFLFREFSMGQDGDFSLKNFKDRSNADLANNLGNLVSRCLNLIDKNRNGQVFDQEIKYSSDPALTEIQAELAKLCEFYKTSDAMEKFEYHKILNEVFRILNLVNKFIELKAPWHLAKDPTKTEELALVLNGSSEAIRLAALVLTPFIPSTSEEILKRLGQPAANIKQLSWGAGVKAKVTHGQPLFMRLQ